MKYYYVSIIAFVVLLLVKKTSTASLAASTDCEVFRSNPNATVIQSAASRFISLWSRLKYSLLGQDSLISRCFGAAKGLKVAMPLIIFKLGVIGTMVAFVAVFSLKGLGLLVTLLMLNFSGFFAKLAAAKGDEKKPQAVHVHVHNKGWPHSPSHHQVHPMHEWYDRAATVGAADFGGAGLGDEVMRGQMGWKGFDE